MTQVIPLTATANQTLSVVLNSQSCSISLRTLGELLYLSMSVSGTPVITTRVCRNLQNLMEDAGYRGFTGALMFVDTQGTEDPEASGLGTRYLLAYEP